MDFWIYPILVEDSPDYLSTRIQPTKLTTMVNGSRERDMVRDLNSWLTDKSIRDSLTMETCMGRADSFEPRVTCT